MRERIRADRNLHEARSAGPSESTKETEEKEIPLHMEYESPPRRIAESVTTRREISVGKVVKRIIEELEEEHHQPSRSQTPHQLARINVIQTELEEGSAERMQELLTPCER